jgi:hypothetical protein
LYLSSYEAQTRGTALGIFPFQKLENKLHETILRQTLCGTGYKRKNVEYLSMIKIDQKSIAQILFPIFRLADQHAA